MNNPKATKKSPAIDALLFGLTGKNRIETIAQSLCTTCAGDALKVSFRDEISFKEYEISGMCQVCQDEIFGEN